MPGSSGTPLTRARRGHGQPGPWKAELTDLVRAASGGLLFGIPLLYTAEVWWVGEHTDPIQAIGVLVLTFLVLLVLNRTSGFRAASAESLGDDVLDTIETVALGVVLVTALLFVLREVDDLDTVRSDIGQIVYQATPFCLGIGVARHYLSGSRDEDDDQDDDGETDGRAGRADRRGKGRADAGSEIDDTVADLGAALLGAVFIALNIAPTEEVPALGAAVGGAGLLGIVALSLAVSYGIVFVAEFADQRGRRAQQGVLQHPVTETVVSYVVALAASAFMLWFFQRLDGPWHQSLSHVVVLGLPAAVGGAAGRLAV